MTPEISSNAFQNIQHSAGQPVENHRQFPSPAPMSPDDELITPPLSRVGWGLGTMREETLELDIWEDREEGGLLLYAGARIGDGRSTGCLLSSSGAKSAGARSFCPVSRKGNRSVDELITRPDIQRVNDLFDFSPKFVPAVRLPGLGQRKGAQKVSTEKGSLRQARRVKQRTDSQASGVGGPGIAPSHPQQFWKNDLILLSRPRCPTLQGACGGLPPVPPPQPAPGVKGVYTQNTPPVVSTRSKQAGAHSPCPVVKARTEGG